MTFNTIDTIVADIIQSVRANNVSQSETLSRVQIESWILNYRVKLLKQDADKGRPIDPWNIQTIPNMRLKVVDIGDYSDYNLKDATDDIKDGYNNNVKTGKMIQRTELKIPKLIDLNFGTTLLVYNPVGEQIQLIPKVRMQTVRDKRWARGETYCYLDRDYIFVEGPGMLNYISVSGVFETVDDLRDYGFSTVKGKFPIPANMIPDIKALIFERDLKWLLSNPTDKVNDSVLQLTPQTSGAPTNGG